MKLRYYLRGLGIGIFVTALILGITSEPGRPLTDAEIRAKALTLGMVDSESRTLSNSGNDAASAGSTPQPTNTPGTTVTTEPGESTLPEKSTAPTESPSPEASVTPTVEPTVEPSASPEPQRTEEPQTAPPATSGEETVTILIVRGDSSYTVSRRLEEAGLVESAGEFDSYLVNNGYSKTVRTGTYQIPLNATWEEIAKMIAG